jgi:transcriptional regulator with XRE-family HTH domain
VYGTDTEGCGSKGVKEQNKKTRPLASIFKTARTEAGLTLRELSACLVVDFTYLSKVENGKTLSVSDDLLYRFSAKFDIDIDELFFAANKIPYWMKAKILERPYFFKNLCQR